MPLLVAGKAGKSPGTRYGLPGTIADVNQEMMLGIFDNWLIDCPLIHAMLISPNQDLWNSSG